MRCRTAHRCSGAAAARQVLLSCGARMRVVPCAPQPRAAEGARRVWRVRGTVRAAPRGSRQTPRTLRCAREPRRRAAGRASAAGRTARSRTTRASATRTRAGTCGSDRSRLAAVVHTVAVTSATVPRYTRSLAVGRAGSARQPPAVPAQCVGRATVIGHVGCRCACVRLMRVVWAAAQAALGSTGLHTGALTAAVQRLAAA